MKPVIVGVLGCGNISAIYLKNCKQFEGIDVVAVADIDPAKAKLRKSEFDIQLQLSPTELLSSPDIEIVLNLTVPGVHYSTCLEVLNSGKHVYLEKPLATNVEHGLQVVSEADIRNLKIGAAPDTFLGAGLQTCRKVIDDGHIGVPIAATANMLCHGHEHWHPDPGFYYQPGGGPLFDMGPYYLTALVSLMGPIKSVMGQARATFGHRTVSSEPKSGTRIDVNTPTHLVTILEFVSGALCTMTMSFDVWSHQQPCLEIYGTEGTMSLPDPNTFGGPVSIKRGREKEWQDVALTHLFAENSRGLGLNDMATAIMENRDHRANGDIALHVLEVMCAVSTSSDTGQVVQTSSRCDRPAPMPGL